MLKNLRERQVPHVKSSLGTRSQTALDWRQGEEFIKHQKKGQRDAANQAAAKRRWADSPQVQRECSPRWGRRWCSGRGAAWDAPSQLRGLSVSPACASESGLPLVHTVKQQETAQVLGSLPPVWESWVELQALGFRADLVPAVAGKGTSRGEVCFFVFPKVKLKKKLKYTNLNLYA